MLEISSIPNQGFLRIILRGDITSASAPQLDQALAVCLVEGSPPRWLLDLGGLAFTSSAGLRVFLAYAKKIKTAGGTLVFCSVQQAVYEVLEISGFTQILTIAPDAEAARPLLASV
jgi:anti-sigma B factor antagonist